MVKREENQPKRGIESENLETKCVKRRRRDPSAVGVARDKQLMEQVDQTSSTPTTTSTVKRSSRFRGVSKHRWTGRFEAHLWDKLSWNVTQKKKGKQAIRTSVLFVSTVTVPVDQGKLSKFKMNSSNSLGYNPNPSGAYDEEESAARAYDLAALKYWGTSTLTNFPVLDYEKEIEIMQTVTKEEYLACLRRKSSGFSRGVSKYRGVARHHHNGRWEARIGRVLGNKYLYLGTYSTQEEAAHAYDIAAIEYRGINAVTNFDLSSYIRWLKPEANTQISTQEQQITNTESYTMPSSLFNSVDESHSLLFHANDFSLEVHETKVPVSVHTKPSSPTALGLLLRSSVFRELVEKNSNVFEDEDVGEDIKHQLQMGGEDGFGGMFFDGFGDIPWC
ncbi:AP2-like ethylene-responsive transcription factor At1g79700 [Actinidia eriantha]|uniref:AP2-like ethylene-responsive transcription factor At1g79700 n=1 Tax=Actinidia eriantha TaxID=165200 RepID=UPI0025875D27|nr:AP2-like ethylene-responsive transcription factor At1g79700 [Actinidia eriantha]